VGTSVFQTCLCRVAKSSACTVCCCVVVFLCWNYPVESRAVIFVYGGYAASTPADTAASLSTRSVSSSVTSQQSSLSQVGLRHSVRVEHETLEPETEIRLRRDRDETETRRLYVTRRYRDVKIGLHVIMIADVNLFSRPLIIIIISRVSRHLEPPSIGTSAGAGSTNDSRH